MMHRFWDDIIQPIFIEEGVTSIVEVGSESGINTVKLLNYCRKRKGKLISIDPEPSFDVEKVEKEYSNFTAIRDYSHKVLERLKGYDAFLLDGDHNWYTVFHELKVIEKNVSDHKQFPIVFLHDIDWPYARRDMYYFPDSIPAEYKKTSEKKGILPGFSELIEPEHELERKAWNKTVFNATFEGGEKNGVLTAIEDFMSETYIPLSFCKVKPNNGLGILFYKNIKLEQFIKELVADTALFYSE